MKRVATGSQTVGPYFRIGLEHLCRGAELAPVETAVVQGQVLDANRLPVPDALLEFWQADARGRYSRDHTLGFARVATDDSGCFRYTTCRPGAVAYDGDRMQAPHIVVLVFARGLLRHLITRMYFPDVPANATDPVLESLPRERRGTLIARSEPDGGLEWNVVLQGQDETVFFAW